MKVLVIGANGQLGSDLLRLQRKRPDEIEMVPLSRKELDVSIANTIGTAVSDYHFDVIINCTGYNKVDEAENHATEVFAINAHAPQRMAAVCKARGAMFVHFSTDYVFDGRSRKPYVETDAPSPVNVYGASKLLGESLVLREYTEGSLIARVASLFGVAGSSGKGGNFVETMLRLAREKGEVRVVNDLRMSPTSTMDVAKALLSLIHQRAAPGIYHIVNSGDATWFEFAQEIIHQAGIAARVVPITSQEYPALAARPAYSVLNNQKVAKLIGLIPHWREALNRYLVEKGHIRQGASSASKG
jgi:dTDP-4-dehydrorhamnose reductase